MSAIGVAARPPSGSGIRDPWQPLTYADSGINIDAGKLLVDRTKPRIPVQAGPRSQSNSVSGVAAKLQCGPTSIRPALAEVAAALAAWPQSDTKV